MSDLRVDWALGGWQNSRFAKTINGRKGIDTDGWYGFQCKDFVNAYFDYVVGWIPGGNAIDLVGIGLPASLQRITYTPGVQLQPGDVFVERRGAFGHTGVVILTNAGGWTSIDQNWFNANDTVGSPPAQVNHNFSLLACVIRVVPGKGAIGGDMKADLSMIRQMAQTVGGRVGRNGFSDTNGPDLQSHIGNDAGQEFLNWYWSDEGVAWRDHKLPDILNVWDKYKDFGPQLEQGNADKNKIIAQLQEKVTELGGELTEAQKNATQDTQLLNDTGNIFTRLFARLFGKK